MPDLAHIWDGGLGDLASAGVEVSDLEVDILYNGGSLMYLRPLGSPLRHAYGHSADMAKYPDGSPVLVPLRVTAISPSALHLPNWMSSDRTVWDHMETEYMPVWKRWPTYIGVADVDSLQLLDNPEIPDWDRMETLYPYRVWCCIPLTGTEDVHAVLRLEEAARSMLEEAKYWETELIVMYESNGEADFEVLTIAYGMAADPLWTKEERKAEKARYKDWARGMVSSKSEAYEWGQRYVDLVEAGIFFWPWQQDAAGGRVIEQLPYKPLTSYLEPDDRVARGLWAEAAARRSYAREQVQALFYPDSVARKDFTTEELIIA